MRTKNKSLAKKVGEAKKELKELVKYALKTGEKEDKQGDKRTRTLLRDREVGAILVGLLNQVLYPRYIPR
jgi:hypothetical protein